MINLPESAKMAKEDLEYILPEVVQVIDTFFIKIKTEEWNNRRD